MATIAYDIAETQRTNAASPLYTFNDQRGLTFAEIVMAVSVERAMNMEAISVSKMKVMTKKNTQIEGYTNCAAAINNQLATGSYPSLVQVTFELPDNFVSATTGHVYTNPKKVTVAEFLAWELHTSMLSVDSERGLPNNQISVNSNNLCATDYLTAYGLLKDQLDSLNTNAQEDMIDIQTYVSRRDTAYKLATNSVKTIMQNATTVAGNF